MRKITLLLVMSILSVSLIACGSDSEGSGDGVTKLELWTTWTEDRPENDIYKKKIEDFNNDHPDIEIVHEGIPNDDIETKLRTQATAGELPDLFKGYAGARMQSFIDAELVMPIDSIMDNWEGMISEELLDNFKFDGKQYTIPGNIAITSLVYYNKEMLNDMGYDEFPADYDDFKELINKLNDNGTTPISLGNKAPWVLQSSYFSSIGDRLTGSDFLQDTENGDAKFTDEKFVEALSIIEELKDMEAFNKNFNTIQEENSRNYFINEESAMHIAGSWAMGPILSDYDDIDNIGVAPFPMVENGDGKEGLVAGTTGNGIYINSELEGKKKEAAEDFLKFFYDEDLYNDLAHEADQLVPVDVDEEGVNDLFVEINKMSDKGLAPVYDATLSPELTDEINKGLQSITTDSITPEDLAKKMQKTNEEE